MKAIKEHQLLLLSLQATDSKISQLKAQIQSLPETKELADVIKRLGEAGNGLKVIQTEEDAINSELKRSENDVELVESRIERDEKRLASGTGTAKEDRKSTRLNSSHMSESRMPSSA